MVGMLIVGGEIREGAFRTRHARHGSHAACGRPSWIGNTANLGASGIGRTPHAVRQCPRAACRLRPAAHGRPLRGPIVWQTHGYCRHPPSSPFPRITSNAAPATGKRDAHGPRQGQATCCAL
jgi:hypothetical protein